jgi:acyl phosphate:glycerol-3-phosphate acyltransferase
LRNAAPSEDGGMALSLTVLALTALASYLVGGVPFGVLVARKRGVDILRVGSGNTGATNVGRVLGRKYGALVFLLDFAKGALPVLAATFLTPFVEGLPPDTLRVAAGVAAFLGHLFPVYLRFRGGKGVATGVGVVAVLMPAEAGLVLLAWAVTLAAGGFVSLASLAAAAVLCLLRFALTPAPWDADHVVVTLFCLLAAALVAVRHAGNIRRLLAGTENRLKDTPAMFQLSKALHVLAVGLWFGTVIFFTVTGGLLFPTFTDEVHKDPPYLPRPAAYDKAPGDEKEVVLKEQAARVFGAAVAPLFPWFFRIQLGCAVVALLTALGWAVRRKGERVHAARLWVLIAATGALSVGLCLDRVVERLRGPRDRTGDVLLREPDPTKEQKQAADDAHLEFNRWHGYSLTVNFAVLVLVAVAAALAANLPTAERPPADAMDEAAAKNEAVLGTAGPGT